MLDREYHREYHYYGQLGRQHLSGCRVERLTLSMRCRIRELTTSQDVMTHLFNIACF